MIQWVSLSADSFNPKKTWQVGCFQSNFKTLTWSHLFFTVWVTSIITPIGPNRVKGQSPQTSSSSLHSICSPSGRVLASLTDAHHTHHHNNYTINQRSTVSLVQRRKVWSCPPTCPGVAVRDKKTISAEYLMCNDFFFFGFVYLCACSHPDVSIASDCPYTMTLMPPSQQSLFLCWRSVGKLHAAMWSLDRNHNYFWAPLQRRMACRCRAFYAFQKNWLNGVVTNQWWRICFSCRSSFGSTMILIWPSQSGRKKMKVKIQT